MKNDTLSYMLVRSNRKTIALYIRPDATVEVRAPKHTPIFEIEKFISSKTDWIRQKLLLTQNQCEQKELFLLDFNSRLLLHGKEFPIIPHYGNQAGFDGERFYMPSHFHGAQFKHTCIQLYKMFAKQVLPARTYDIAQQMNLSPANIRITSAKSQWGSCSAKKNISYSWRLIMADEEVVDYVIVHELAHLVEMNHSTRFWNIVASALPDYKERQKQLKELQKRLAVEVWD